MGKATSGGGLAWWHWALMAVGAAGVFGLGLLVGNWMAPSGGGGAGPAGGGGHEHAAAEQAVQWWTCSMHPQIRQPHPGKCPICGMDLVPVEAGAGEGLRVLKVSEASRALMGIQTSAVERRFVTAEIRMVGKVDYDETRLAYITAWTAGRVDRLFVDTTGVPVARGDHMAYLYSPDLLAAQEELIQARKAVAELGASDTGIIRQTAEATVAAAREKLRLLGLTAEQVAAIEQSGVASDHVTIYSPAGGIVIAKHVQEGSYVQTGMRIYTVADLAGLWVQLDAYESDLMWLRYGQQVTFTTEAYADRPFTGRISFIDPVLTPGTRTVKLRVNVPNDQGLLKPGMFVRAVVRTDVAAGGRVMAPQLAGKWICPMHPEVIKDHAGDCDVCGMPLVRIESLGYVTAASRPADAPLVVPASAVLITGTRAVVYLEVPNAERPTFEGRQILLGPRAGDYYIVRNGLAEGDRVVTEGSFKIDSALQIQAAPSMMTPAGGAPGPPQQLPEQMAEQMRMLVAAAEAAGEAAAGDDLSKAKAAFATVKQRLDAVNAEKLAGRGRAVWADLAMLLDNDAVEGSRHADTLEAARRVAGELAGHVRRLGESFVLGEPAGAALPAAPAAFCEQLAGVLDAYLSLSAALAGDDLAKATAAAAAVKAALAKVDMKLLAGDLHERWMAHLGNLRTGVEQAAAGTDLEGVRKGFALLSEEMAAVVRVFLGGGERTVYELHCPMAFNSRGANWLSERTDVQNPYFGAAMPKCGAVSARLAGPPGQAASQPGTGAAIPRGVAPEKGSDPATPPAEGGDDD